MVPGEYRVRDGSIQLNEGRRAVEVVVCNSGDRPIQVGSHYCFFEVNRALEFDREQAFGMRLDIAAGTAMRFEPGEEKPVRLVQLGGDKIVHGLNNITSGSAQMDEGVQSRLADWEEKGR